MTATETTDTISAIITWPSGRTTTWTGPADDMIRRLTEVSSAATGADYTITKIA